MLIISLLLFVLCSVGALVLFFKTQNRDNKKPFIAVESVLGALALIFLIYAILNGIFISSKKNETTDTEETSSASAVTQSYSENISQDILDSTNPVSETFDDLISTRKNHEITTLNAIETESKKDSHVKMPLNHPDALGFTQKDYPKNPVLRTANDMSVFYLSEFISGNFDLTFYIPRNEFYLPVALDTANSNARTYYLFGSVKIYNSNTEDLGDKRGVTARFTLKRYNVKTDIEAFNVAVEYVKNHPVPSGGFKNYNAEKEYMRDIHDYVAKITEYDPKGYNSNELLQSDIYDAKQEAYNSLIEHSAVCAGYAKAVALIAQCAGIDCAWVYGNDTGSSSHAWNIVYPCDGSEPVVVDATWDDHPNLDNPGKPLYDHFYVEVSKDTLHSVDESMWNFLKFVHK